MEPNQPSSQLDSQQVTPNEGTGTALVSKKRGFWRRTRQVAAWLILIVIAIGLAGLLLIQLPVFKRLVVGQLVSTIENSTNGTLTVGEIKGNLLEGFVMNDVTLRLKTGTNYDTVPFIHADHIIARYSLFRWLRTNEFGITEMVLQHPVIRFVKFAGDTMWNYRLFAKPVATAPKGPPQPFTQIVDLSSFRIQNGSLSVRDYNYPARQPHVIVANVPSGTAPGRTKTMVTQVQENEIDWSDMQVEGIDLDGHLYVHGSSAQSVRVNHLRFTEKQSGFFVQHLEFSGYRDSIQARMDDAKITTGHSDINFSIEVAPPKIITTGLLTSLQHSLVKATISGPVISTYELKQFFPEPLGFLAGSPGIDLVANGEFGKLHIQKLALDFKGQGSIAIAGELDNLHQADSLSMNLNLQARNLSNTTLDDYVPGLHLPNLSRFGTINISNLAYVGEPLNFHTKFDAKSTGAGNVAGDVVLDLRNQHLTYRAGMKTTNFNVAALAKGKQLESSITAETQLAGKGTNWKTMNSTITAKTDAPSSFGKYRITSLELAGAIQSGTVTAEHLDAIVVGGPEVHIRSAMVGLTNPKLPFRFDGTVKDFQLAEILSSNNPARVDLDADLAGSAKDFENVTGTAHARLFNLEYRGHALPDDTLDLKISPTTPGENNLTLRSQIADVTIDHRFQLGTLTEDIPTHLNALFTAIEQRDFPENGEHFPISNSCSDSIDFDYHIQIKDLRPLADFLPRTFLLGQGAISGTARGCPDGDLNLTVNGDSLAFILRNRQAVDTNLADVADTALDTLSPPTFVTERSGHTVSVFDSGAIRRRDTSALALPQFGEGTPRIQFMPTTFRLNLRNLSNDPRSVLDHLEGSLDFLSDSVVRLGSALLFHPKLGLVYKNQVLDFDAATVYNDALGVHLKGDAHFPEGNFDFALDTLLVNYINPYYTPGTLQDYAWVNEGPAHIRLSKAGRIDVDTITILHSLRNGENPGNVDAMRMKFAGTLEGDTVSATLFVPSFNLEKLKKIIPPFKPNAKTFDFASFNGKVRDMNVTLTGTLERPNLAAKLFADSMTYGDVNPILFDSNALDLTYRDQVLRGTLALHVENFTTTAPGLQPINSAGIKGQLRAVIDSIPMTIAFERGPNFPVDSARAAERPLAAHIDADNFPLDVVTPFLPLFRQVQGTGDVDFAVTGTRENIDYAGKASVRDGALLLAATNMWYRFGGPLTFAHNALTLQNDTLRNIDADDPHGDASLNGSLNFSGFNITNFDLRLHSRELMVLSDAAKQTQMPVYGPVIINTDGDDFRFYNTFKAPSIKGTINIMSANITMPQTSGQAQPVSNAGIIYETLPNDSIERLNVLRSRIRSTGRQGHRMAAMYAVGAESVQMSSIDDTLFPNRMKNIYLNEDGSIRQTDTAPAITTAGNGLAPSFADIIRMHLLINTQGNATISIPFGGALGLIGAELKAELVSGGTLSIERGDDLQTAANGRFDLSPNSTFTFYKPFNISKGNITFTKDFGNPQIFIVADYTGSHTTQSGSADNARIQFTVTGTKDQPVLTAQNFEDIGGTFEERSEPSPEAAKEDAIYFLATGQFKSELTLVQGANATNNILTNLTTGLGTNLINNFLGSTSTQVAIRSASLNFGTNNSGGQITTSIRDITFKLGGYTYGTAGSNFNLTTDIPFNSIPSLSAASWARNMMIEIQGNSNPTVAGANALTQQPIFLAKWVWTFARW
ncbi:MAG TPA: translocation/assembly module TamB domain-containing protein [Candidatus Kapabacteria bacterium]|nr:translocation/assembly module TamB domain-containing protein [Candidatus Kapabacteria bacterium]